MKTNKIDSETELKTQLSAEWEKDFISELNKKIPPRQLSREIIKWVENRRLAKDKEINQKLDLAQNEKVKEEKELECEKTKTVSAQLVEKVIAPLIGIDPIIIKTQGILALVFHYMYHGITQSHPWSIKSTPKESETFETTKKKMIEWIEAIKFRDSDITIHTVVTGIKNSDGIIRPNRRENKHLPSDGWKNRYDTLMDNLSNLVLPSKEKTFYAKRDSWKNSLNESGMKNEKNRATLVNAIIEFRVQVQEDLDSVEHHDERMKSIDLWIKDVPKSIKELSQKLYYFN